MLCQTDWQGGPKAARFAMGYYGLPKAKLPDELNALEKLLRSLPLEGSIEALDLLETLTRNAIQNFLEEKYRRVRTTNEKLSALFKLEGTLDIMLEMGWLPDGEFMVLPQGVQLDFPRHVVKILEAKSFYGKMRVQAKKTAKLGDDPNKAQLLQQLELDRRERAARASAAPLAPVVMKEAAPLKSEANTIDPELLAAAAEDPELAAAIAASLAPVSREEEKKPKSAFEFQRPKPEQKRQEAEMSLQELRELQKQKYKEFEAAPDEAKQEAYARAAAAAPQGKQEQSWYEWAFGGDSSSSGGGGGGGSGGGGGGARMKTMRDLPKPAQRG